jgi:hypothetical protein
MASIERLPGQLPDEMAAPEVSAQGEPPSIANQPNMPTQPGNKGTKTGLRAVLSGMLQNFSYGAGQAMKKEAGLPTDAEIAEQNAKLAFTNAQAKLMQAEQAQTMVPVEMPDGTTLRLPQKFATELFKERLKGLAGVEKQKVANQGAAERAQGSQGVPMKVDSTVAELVGMPELAGQEVGKATLDNINKMLTARGYKQQDYGFEGMWLVDRAGNKLKKTGDSPMVDRMRALGMGRVVKVADQNDPSKVNFAFAGDAVSKGLPADTSGTNVAARAIDKYFTSGKGSQTLNAFNTARMHMDTLGGLAVALNNGDVQAINRAQQEYAKQTGNPAPSNFDSARAAVAGEVAAAFKSSGATDIEIQHVTDPITKASSPAQLAGVIQTFSELLEGKRKALQGQYEAGRQGKPAFPENINPPEKQKTGKPKTASDYLGKFGGQ